MSGVLVLWAAGLFVGVEESSPIQGPTIESSRASERHLTGGCACDANVRQPDQPIVDILDWAAVLGCAFSNNCSGCDVSCDVNCDGVVDVNDVGAAWCRSIGGGSLGPECCTDPIGACIDPNSSGLGCVWTTEASCDLANDTFVGPGHTCLTGACITAGVCDEVAEARCFYDGGSFQGIGSECPSQSLGACLTPGGGCTFTTPQGCSVLGGTFSGEGTSCDRGACIVPGVGCSEVGTAQTCAVLNGTFLGPGTTCPECISDSDCPPGFGCNPANECTTGPGTIPTVSTWGVVTLALLLLTGGKIRSIGKRAS